MSRVLLEEIINHFEPGKFTRFFREKNSKFAPREESYREYDEENFVNGNKLGEISFDGTEQVVVVTFEAKQPLSERSGKRAQYEKGKRILKDKQYDAGIFVFYDPQGNFRFSLIYANYLGRRRDWSTFRRFTYFVSSDPESTNKTFKQRIGDADFSTLEKIKDAFSVEKVTQSFYTDIANWYFWAVQCSTYPKGVEDEENGRNIAIIRLVTRLIFIWFMKERGLVPATLFNKSEIINLLNNLDSKETTYYKAILQNLFFATLNTKNKDRKYRFQDSFQGKNADYMDHSIYRYESYFKDKNIMLEIFKDIPFLNGGLFDCLDRASKDNNDQGEIRIDGFSDKDVGLKVPNLLFFSDVVEADLNKEYGTSNKKYHVRGLLDILQSYNFTIDENDPNDQEVALDPELLGKVFENLLASFNPETASTARKATGSYYTPREIVDYMVSESLKNYFKTGVEIEGMDDKLTTFFSVENDENPFDSHQTLKLVDLINDLRVVDPAVGSGAFPMGILNKLVFILGKLDPDNTLWKNAQIKAIETGVTDPILRKHLTDQVEEKFNNNKNYDYGRKLYLIQKCIYGVDIQQIAVEIAKLRFFISLLVDEKIDKTKENWGVEPLPNLDYKIMQGNSLLEEYEGIKLFDERLLNITLPDESESKEIEAKIKAIERELMPFYIKEPRWMKSPKLERPQELIVLESEMNRLRLAQKDLIKFNQAKIVNGSQSQLQFQAEEGQSQEVWLQLQDLHKKLFTPTLTRDDKREIKKEIDRLEWRLIEATLREQNKTKELEKIEKMENSNTKPFFLWRLYFPEVFEEKKGFDIVIGNPPYGVDINESQMIAIKRRLRDTKNTNSAAIFIDFGKNILLNNKGTLSYIVPKSLLFSEVWFDLVKSMLGKVSVLVDVEKAFDNVLLEQVLFVYGNSINTNSYYARKFIDKDFIRSLTIQNSVVDKFKAWICDVSEDEINIAFKILDSANINLLGMLSETKRGVGLQKHLKQRGEFPVIGGKNITKYGISGIKGYLTREDLSSNAEKISFMQQKKIISQNIVAHVQNPIPHLVITATLDDSGNILTLDTVNNTIINGDYEIKYILAILNSSLISWYAYKFIYCAAIRTMHFDSSYIGKIPIVKASEEVQNNIADLVDELSKKVSDGIHDDSYSSDQSQTEKINRELNNLIYDLYGISNEDIETIEGGSDVS